MPGVATYDVPLSIIRGQRFRRAWRLRESATALALDLDRVTAFRFTAQRRGAADAVEWTPETGEMARLAYGEIAPFDVLTLNVPGVQTQAMPRGPWDFRLWVGFDGGAADTPIARGVLDVEG